MERHPKRRRLYAPLDSTSSRPFDNRHEYYETPATELQEESQPAYGPDQELEQKRARLDFKLKSTFESIFEKYSKDFDGVGDEIDLYTGEIVVDNGHLLQMRNEKDAGDVALSGILPEDSEGLTTSSVEGDGLEDDDDDEDEEEDYDDEEAITDEDMIEDDMILRGFTQARQFMERQASPQQGAFDIGFMGRKKEPRRNNVVAQPATHGGKMPSRSDILSQFGPQLGAEIAQYVSQQSVHDDSNVEPMWRAPPLPTMTEARRPILKPVSFQPDDDRSISPDNAPSIWAPSERRFKAEEDQLLKDFITSARNTGLDLSDSLSWRQLEEMHPRHDWKSWKSRYEKKFSYIYSGSVDESEVSTSEISTDSPWTPNQRGAAGRASMNLASSTSIQPARPPGHERPTRIRKQAQQDSTILSWSDAVATVESVDPELHAGLLRDARRMKSDASFGLQRKGPQSQLPDQGVLQDTPRSQKQMGSSRLKISQSSKRPTYSYDLSVDTEDELALYNSDISGEFQTAPCPHVDCSNFASTLYRLELHHDEDLSPLCLHLLHIHHITPFPCAEFNCDRKGERGYFMQEDLVKHVREAHPYATALARLRGRVDPSFFDRGLKPTHRPQSKHGRLRTPDSQPRYGGFMLSPARVSRPSQARPHASFSDTPVDITSNPLCASSPNQAALAGASSLRLNPSSSTTKATEVRGNSVEILYDSDVQILDENPFVTKDIPPSEEAKFSCPLKASRACDEMFTTQELASAHSLTHSKSKAPCPFPGCGKMISTARPATIAHLKSHQKDGPRSSPPPSAQPVTAPKPQNVLPSSILNSTDSSTANIFSSTTIPAQTQDRGTRRKRVSEPLPRNTIDPSYQFSDEEIELPLLIKDGPHAPPMESAKAKPGRNPIPPAETLAEASPGLATKPPGQDLNLIPSTRSSIKKPSYLGGKPPAAKRTSTLAAETTKSGAPTPAVKPSFVTPLAKAQPRKSAVQEVVASEVDELSLGADDDLMFISSKPRSGPRFSLGLHARVKLEDTNTAGRNSSSSRDRRLSTLRQSDEVDELVTDEGAITSSSLRTQILTDRPRVKKENEAGASTNKSSKSAKSGQHKVESFVSAAPKPTTTPVRSHKRPVGTSTPLIDLVADEDGGDRGVLPTSVLDSSPTARQTRARMRRDVAVPSPAQGLLTPMGLRGGPRAATVKQESESVVVWTPGGTLRRCGENGFACGRAFCFTCSR